MTPEVNKMVIGTISKEFRSRRIKKPHLIAVSIVFGLIGAYLIFQAFALTPATTLYVDKDSKGGACDDSRAASEVNQTKPLCSIPRALNLAAPGSKILVRAGDYPIFAVNNMQNAAPVSVEAQPGEAVILSAGFTVNKSSGYVFKGFQIRSYVKLFYDDSDIAIINNDITPRGIDLRNNSKNILIEGNNIHDIARDACN